MKQLIVNADDFGFTKGVSDGIIEAFRNGIVTSTSIMANGDAFEYAIDLARKHPDLSLGCHLTLVGGRSVASAKSVPNLVDEDGMLPKTLSTLTLRWMTGRLRKAEIVKEFRAQIEKVIAAGITPSHLDTHKHSQVLPVVMDAFVEVASSTGVRCIRNPYEDAVFRKMKAHAASGNGGSFRQYSLSKIAKIQQRRFHRMSKQHDLLAPDHFFGVTHTGKLDAHTIRVFLERIQDGPTEMMCHPGFYDAELDSAKTRLKQHRASELAALTDPEVRSHLQRLNIQLINYRTLQASNGNQQS